MFDKWQCSHNHISAPTLGLGRHPDVKSTPRYRSVRGESHAQHIARLKCDPALYWTCELCEIGNAVIIAVDQTGREVDEIKILLQLQKWRQESQTKKIERSLRVRLRKIVDMYEDDHFDRYSSCLMHVLLISIQNCHSLHQNLQSPPWFCQACCQFWTSRQSNNCLGSSRGNRGKSIGLHSRGPTKQHCRNSLFWRQDHSLRFFFSVIN